MSTSQTNTQHTISLSAGQLGQINVSATDGATDANMLALAEALKTWSTNNPTNILISVSKFDETFVTYTTDLTASPAAFD